MRQLLSKEHVNLFTVLFTFVIVSKQCFCLLCFTINAIEKINTEGLFQQNLKWYNSATTWPIFLIQAPNYSELYGR